MVIVYELATNKILYTERGVMTPQLPVGATEEKKQILEQEGKGFVGVPYEMDLEVFDYLVCFDSNGKFLGLQPK